MNYDDYYLMIEDYGLDNDIYPNLFSIWGFEKQEREHSYRRFALDEIEYELSKLAHDGGGNINHHEATEAVYKIYDTAVKGRKAFENGDENQYMIFSVIEETCYDIIETLHAMV